MTSHHQHRLRIASAQEIRAKAIGGPPRITDRDKRRADALRRIETRRWLNESRV